MKLTTVTITGIDQETDLDLLKDLQQEYPFVEWGVLLSYHHKENGNRYFDPQMLKYLRYGGLRLSAHFCGSMALDILNCETDKVYEFLNYQFDIFSRCQMNLNTVAHFGALRTMRPFTPQLKEVILQMRDDIVLDSYLRFTEKPTPKISYLLDASGGRGINTPIEVSKQSGIHIGYAGGINPENVAEKLTTLLNHPTDDKFWIDMETGVRTDDWLDMNKVEEVLRISDNILSKS